MGNETPNDILIKKLSEKISYYRPDAKVIFSNIPDRQKGLFIIQFFPWPIGVEIRRLLSGDRVIQDQNRLEQLLKVGERSIQFLTFALMCDLWSNKDKMDFSISPGLKDNINKIDRPSLGTWVGILESCSSFIIKFNDISFFSGIDVNWKKINQLSSQISQMRNTKVHHTGSLEFTEFENIIGNLLVELCFLTKFKMVTVRDINVRKSRLNPVKFEHVLAQLNSTHKDFEAEKNSASSFVESQGVLLLSEDNISGNYLNLFPLIIDTKAIQNPNAQAKGLVHGIFIYHHREKSKLVYTGTEPLSNTEPSLWGIEESIIAELDDLKKSLINE